MAFIEPLKHLILSKVFQGTSLTFVVHTKNEAVIKMVSWRLNPDSLWRLLIILKGFPLTSDLQRDVDSLSLASNLKILHSKA